MNKSQSKYFNTARFMDEALLQLLEKKSFPYITVKEVCKKAGVNRSTFYLHYETMTDLLAESIDYLKGELRQKYEAEEINVKNAPLEELNFISHRYTEPYLQFIFEHKKAFLAAVSQPNVFQVDDTFYKMFETLFSPILARYGVPEGERMYRMKFYMNGIHAVIIEWIKGGCKDEISLIADLIITCVYGEQKE